MVKHPDILDTCIKLHRERKILAEFLNTLTLETQKLTDDIGTEIGTEKYHQLLETINNSEKDVINFHNSVSELLKKIPDEELRKSYIALGAAIEEEKYEDCASLTERIETLEK